MMWSNLFSSLVIIGAWAKRKQVILLLLLIILIGAILRIYDLGAESLWLDEAISENFSKGNITYIIEESGPQHNNPPLYWVLLHYWMVLFGNSEAALRSLSAILGIAAVIVTYFVGKELYNQKVGLISSFLSAISYFHIYYSQEARGYALLLFLSVLSYFLFIKTLKSDRNWYYPFYFLATFLLGYSHVYGLFVIASQIFYFILYWGKYPAKPFKLVATLAATILSLLPLIILLGPKTIGLVNQGFWLEKPSLSHLVGALTNYSGFGEERYVLFLLFFFLALFSLFSVRRTEGTWVLRKPFHSLKSMSWKVGFHSFDEVLMLLLWLSFPIVIPFIISQVTTPIYLIRYTIGASPAFYLLVAKGVSTLDTKRILYPVLIVVMILSGLGLHRYYVYDVKEQWREAAEFVEVNSRERDIIFNYQDWEHTPFAYYYKGSLPEFEIPWGADVQEVATLIDKVIGQKDRLWFIKWRGGRGSSVWDYLTQNYDTLTELNFNGVGVLLIDLPREGSQSS